MKYLERITIIDIYWKTCGDCEELHVNKDGDDIKIAELYETLIDEDTYVCNYNLNKCFEEHQVSTNEYYIDKARRVSESYMLDLLKDAINYYSDIYLYLLNEGTRKK